MCAETLRAPGAQFYTLRPVIISEWKNYFSQIDPLKKINKCKSSHGPLRPRAPKQLLGLHMASYATGLNH